MVVMPGALGLISSTHNLAWWLMHFLSELERQKQEDQKIQVILDYR